MRNYGIVSGLRLKFVINFPMNYRKLTVYEAFKSLRSTNKKIGKKLFPNTDQSKAKPRYMQFHNRCLPREAFFQIQDFQFPD